MVAQETKKERDRELLGANSEGTHFFVGFMENELYECSYEYGERLISIASRFKTAYSITLPNGYVIKGILQPMQLHSHEVERRYECVGEGVFNNGIEIKSDLPISVYCYSSRPMTSDGYLALPVDAWGTQYLTANHYVDHYTHIPDSDADSICNVYPRGGEFAIIAAEDNTQVTVYPKTRTYREVGLVTKTLMKGQMYQLQDGGQFRGVTDLTGSVVTSDKPVGLLSGHVRTAIPVQFDTKDHLIEMIPPRNELGSNYIAVPFGGRQGGDLVRIISTDPGTNVTISTASGSGPQYIGEVGEFIEFILTEVTVIDADKPVLVTQYSRSTGVDPRNDSIVKVNFDPDMVVVTPQEQFVNAAVFQTLPNKSKFTGDLQFERHYVTIVAEAEKFSTMLLDGQPLPSFPEYNFGQVPGQPYVWATMQVEDGRIHVISGDALFGGYVYGLGVFDSYAWPIGAGNRKFDITDANPPQLAAEQDCGGFSVTAREKGPFESGLRNAWMDSSYTQNIEFERVMLIIGDEFSIGKVTLADPRQSGKARFIAEDLHGNRDTIELTLQATKVLGFDKEFVEFTDVVLGPTYQKDLLIANVHAEPIKIDTARFLHHRFLLQRSYTGEVIQANGSLKMEALFAASQLKDVFDTLLIKSNCQTYRIPYVARTGAPAIATHDLEFGSLRVGSERGLPLRVWNPGSAVLHLSNTVIAGDGFTMDPTIGLAIPDSLLPGAETTITVYFKPGWTGDFTGTIHFHSDADSIAIARLHGVGIYPAVSIGSYDFGLIPVGDTACTTVPVANTGTDTLHLTDVMLSSPGYAVNPSNLPRDLAPGDTAWVEICFIPVQEQEYLSDAFPQNEDGVEATGKLTGSGYQVRASLSGYDWKERWVYTSHDTVVHLRNLSSQPLTIESIFIDQTAGDPGDFEIVDPAPGLPVVLAAGEALPINVRFTPLLPGLRSCIIRGTGGVPGGPSVAVDSILQGFGLIALASDDMEFNDSLAFSCGSRIGYITIHNDGNTMLTLAGMEVESTPNLVRLSDPAVASQKIPVGESLRVDFITDIAGYVGTMNGSISWSFVELPDTLRRTFTLTSAPQIYHISASVPGTVKVGSDFDLNVRVDSSFWRMNREAEVEMHIEHNPRLTRFDMGVWATRTISPAGPWVPVGVPVVKGQGSVTLRFRPLPGMDSAMLTGENFIALPFESFLANNTRDTFRITMTVPGNCVLASHVDAPYVLDSICALDYRLFEFTGIEYGLKQNRPNPTGISTQIEFNLGMEAHTTLELFAPDGRSVRVLINEPLPAGAYDVPVDLSELPSGLYFYRLTSGPFSAVRQMTVAK